MFDLTVVFTLLVLHSPDGREIGVALDEVTSVHCRLPGVESNLFAPGVNTVINTTDGKHVAVAETCSEVRDAIKDLTK